MYLVLSVCVVRSSVVLFVLSVLSVAFLVHQNVAINVMASSDAEPAAMEPHEPQEDASAPKRRWLCVKTPSPRNHGQQEDLEEPSLPVEPKGEELVAPDVDDEDLPEDDVGSDKDQSWQQGLYNRLRRWCVQVGVVPNDGKGSESPSSVVVGAARLSSCSVGQTRTRWRMMRRRMPL